MANPLTPTADRIRSEERRPELETPSGDAGREQAAQLAAVRDELGDLNAIAAYLCELAERQLRPASIETVVLSSDRPIFTSNDRADPPAPSIGLLNPTPIVVYLGIAGGRATAGGRAIAVPPNSALVLPIVGGDLEVGAAAGDLAAGDAVLALFRFPTVQPLSIGFQA